MTRTGNGARASALEALLKRDRLAVVAGLVSAVALSWLYLVPSAVDMYGAMDGPARWMMAATWDARYFLLVFLMWAVMMVGMMLPSAAPMILLYGTVARGSGARVSAAGVYIFAAGYLLAWTGFSLAATVLQWMLSELALLSPMMESASPALGGVVLLAAGLYQWTPLKNRCLTHCRSPVQSLTQLWRPGLAGALRMGLVHGIYCVGCCWALMGLLFVGGVMNLTWIGAITIFVLLEKLAPHGAQGGRLSGSLLAVAGVLVLVFR